MRRRVGDLGLEHDPPLLDPGERPAEPDQLTHPRAVDRRSAVGLGVDADLLGVHRDAGGVEGREVVGGRTPYGRVGRELRGPGERQVRLVPPGLPRRAPSCRRRRPTAATPASWSPTMVTTDRGRVSARSANARASSGAHSTGTRLAPTWQPATSRPVVVPTPDLAGQQPRLEVGAAGAVLGERVHHRVATGQLEEVRQVGGSEHAHSLARAEPGQGHAAEPTRGRTRPGRGQRVPRTVCCRRRDRRRRARAPVAIPSFGRPKISSSEASSE